jgi:hypothetical protein
MLTPRLLADSYAVTFAAGPPKQRIAETLDLREVRYRRIGPDLLVTGTLPQRDFAGESSEAGHTGRAGRAGHTECNGKKTTRDPQRSTASGHRGTRKQALRAGSHNKALRQSR